MHEVIGVLVDNENDVTETLERYDENKDIVETMTEEEIREYAKEYLSLDDIENVEISNVLYKLEREGGIYDSKKTLKGTWKITHRNPEGMWDYWQVGGRWDGIFASKNILTTKNYIKKYLTESDDPAEKIVDILDNKPAYIPSIYVTEETWQEYCDYSLKNDWCTPMAKAEIVQFILNSKKKYIIFVDIHH